MAGALFFASTGQMSAQRFGFLSGCLTDDTPHLAGNPLFDFVELGLSRFHRAFLIPHLRNGRAQGGAAQSIAQLRSGVSRRDNLALVSVNKRKPMFAILAVFTGGARARDNGVSGVKICFDRVLAAAGLTAYQKFQINFLSNLSRHSRRIRHFRKVIAACQSGDQNRGQRSPQLGRSPHSGAKKWDNVEGRRCGLKYDRASILGII